MCRVDLNIDYTDLTGNGVIETEAQYRGVGTGGWIPFTLDINDPKSPNLFVNGKYLFRVRLNNGTGWSAWKQGEFWIGCGAFDSGFDVGFEI